MVIKKELEYFQDYLSDASGFRGIADVLYIPENIEDLIELVRNLNSEEIPFTIAGSGTGLTGSRVPNAGVIISLEKFNQILVFNEAENYIVCGVGIRWRELNDFLETKGYYLPPNPTEYNSALGGNIACNSSGSRTYKYGAIRNYIQAMNVVLANGDEIYLDREDLSQNSNNNILNINTKYNNYKLKTFDLPSPNTKNAAGYFIKSEMHAIDLFIGAEGTLGITTQAKVLFKKIPQKLIGLIVYFEDDSKLLDFVERIKSFKNYDNNKENTINLETRLIEYFDTNALKIISEKYSIPKEAKFAIWLEQEVEIIDDKNAENIDDLLEKWYELVQEYSTLSDYTWVAIDEKQHNEMKEFRHYLPLQIYENLAKSNFVKIGTDSAVEDKYFREYYQFMKENLSKIGIYAITFGHIGNNHLHINLFGKDENEKLIALDFYEKLMQKTIELGGTVSAEHGIGKLKKKYFKMMYNENYIKKMKKIKLTFDPNNLLNKGNIFDI
jgi:D-lactate dehydrogenase (cytochrome)